MGLEYLATVFHLVFSGRRQSIPTKQNVSRFLNQYVIGPQAYVTKFLENFYSKRISAKDHRGYAFARSMREIHKRRAEDVLMAFARARVGHFKKAIEKTLKTSTTWMSTVDAKPKDVRRVTGIQPTSERIRNRILCDIRESFFVPSNKAETPTFSANIVEMVDRVLTDQIEGDRVTCTTTSTIFVVSSHNRSPLEVGGTITPEIISLASSDEEDNGEGEGRFSIRFDSDFNCTSRFVADEPTKPSCSTLNRALSGTEQLWLTLLKCFCDGALCNSSNSTIVSYKWHHSKFGAGRSFMGGLNYTAIERIFKNDFLCGDQGAQ